MLVTQIAIFLEGFVDNAFEFRGDIAVQAYRRSRNFVEDAVEDSGRGVSFKRQ